MFAQETLLETSGGFYFLADDRSVIIVTALQRLLKIVPITASGFADLIWNFVDAIRSSRAATTEARREVERQKGLVSVAKKPVSDAFSDAPSLQEPLVVTNKR